MQTLTNPNTFRLMVARYDSGVCSSCARNIKTGDEILYRASDKKIHHVACPIEPISLEEMGFTPNNESMPPIPLRNSEIPDGYYTAVLADGSHRTFRVRTQSEDAEFAPNQQIIATLVGPDNSGDYKGWGFINNGRINVWKSRQNKIGDWYEIADAALFTNDYKKAGLAYATQSGNCYRCNRLLTEPESIARGLGPICAGKE
jgi:hypothetical protein